MLIEQTKRTVRIVGATTETVTEINRFEWPDPVQTPVVIHGRELFGAPVHGGDEAKFEKRPHGGDDAPFDRHDFTKKRSEDRYRELLGLAPVLKPGSATAQAAQRLEWRGHDVWKHAWGFIGANFLHLSPHERFEMADKFTASWYKFGRE